MSIFVNITDLAPGQSYAFRFRSYNGDGYSDWSQIFRYRTTGDLIAPEAITGLQWDVVGGTFVGRWNRVYFDAQGKRLDDFKDYEIKVSNGTVTKTYYQIDESFSFGPDLNKQEFGAIMTTLTITVAARDYTGNLGVSASKTATDPIPPIPSTPVTSINMGQIVVSWDGKSNIGNDMPYNFSYLEVHASTTSNFTPSASTLNQTFTSKTMAILSGLTYNTTYYIKFIAVNDLGRKSDPSAQASGMPTRISGLDIADNGISVQQINFVDKLGGVKAYYANAAPTGANKDDLWYNTTPGKEYEVSRYSGTAWVVAPEVGVVSGKKILAGTLTSDAVGTNLLIANEANIGNIVIDQSKIGILDAGKITTGTLQSSSTVTYGGVSQPAWSVDLLGMARFSDANILGQLVVGNSDTTKVTNNANVLLRSYNYLPGTAGWAIKGDGSVEFAAGVFRGNITGATITGGTISATTQLTSGISIDAPKITGGTIKGGTIQTSDNTYPRVVMDTTGITLFNAAGSPITTLSATTGVATITGLFRSNSSGPRVEINSSFQRPESATPGQYYSAVRIFSGNLYGDYGEIGVGDTYSSSYPTLQMISPGATASNGSFLRLNGNNTYELYGNGAGSVTTRAGLTLQGNITGTSGNLTLGGYNINATASNNINLSGGGSVFLTNGGGKFDFTCNPATFATALEAIILRIGGYGNIAIGPLQRNTGTPGIRLTGGGADVSINGVYGNGAGLLAVRNSTDQGVADISCGYVFNTGIAVGSDTKLKSNVTTVSGVTMLDEVMAAQVYEYDLINNSVVTRSRGIMAQEAPSIMVTEGGEAVPHKSIDLYALVSTAVGAIQEQNVRLDQAYDIIDELRQEIDLLKGTP